MAGFMKLEVYVDENSEKFLARYSAPGYLDCTDECEGETPEEAARNAAELFGDNEKGSDDRKELAGVLRQIRKARREGRI